MPVIIDILDKRVVIDSDSSDAIVIKADAVILPVVKGIVTKIKRKTNSTFNLTMLKDVLRIDQNLTWLSEAIKEELLSLKLDGQNRDLNEEFLDPLV